MPFTVMSLMVSLAVPAAAEPPWMAPPQVVHMDATDARPVVVRGGKLGPFPGAPEATARALLEMHGGWLGLDGVDLRPSRSREWRGRWVVHLEQHHGGVPVHGGGLVVGVEDGFVVWLSSHVQDVRVGSLPAVDERRAVAVALAEVAGEVVGPVEASLRVEPDPWGGRLVWLVVAPTWQPLGRHEVRVDATSGEVLGSWDGRIGARGQVYEQNPVNSDLIEVELHGLPDDALTMDGDLAKARTVVFESGEMAFASLAEPDEDGDFIYEPEEGRVDEPFTEVNAYWHVSELGRWFQEVHGHVFARPATIYTNYREEEGGTYDNAFFTRGPDGGYVIATGQGTVDLGYDNDVLQHEFGHGVVDDLTNVNSGVNYPFGFDQHGFHVAPHAMNEGMADYWASTFSGDPCTAEYFGSAIGMDCLRDLDNDMTTPEDIFGEAHYDGMVVGGTAWDVREALGAEVADHLLYGALGAVSPTPTFQELAEALLDAAGVLVADGELGEDKVELLNGILDERGWLRSGRWIPMEDGVPETGTLLGADLVSGYMGSDACTFARSFGIVFPTPFQYSFTVPDVDEETLEGLDIKVELATLGHGGLGVDDLDYRIYLRRDDMITYETYNLRALMGTDYIVLKDAVDWDLAVENGASVRLEPGDAALPLEAGATYYIALAGMNCPITSYTITASLDLLDPPVEEDEGGCGCAAGDHRPAGIALATLVLGASLARRSRRGFRPAIRLA